jgi:hypothetical protein
MKKNILLFSIIFSIVTLGLFAGGAEIVKIKGSAKLFRQGAFFGIIKVGDKIFKNDVITTSSKSFCDIKFSEKVFARIEENSNISIKDLAIKNRYFFYDNVKVKLQINSGMIHSKMRSLRKNETFRISTPVAVAGVRGTEFITSHIGNQTNISVTRGIVSLNNLISNKHIFVKPGQTIQIASPDNTKISDYGKVPSIPSISDRGVEAASNIDYEKDSGKIAPLPKIKGQRPIRNNISDKVLNVPNSPLPMKMPVIGSVKIQGKF